jgi:hypothetical protein
LGPLAWWLRVLSHQIRRLQSALRDALTLLWESERRKSAEASLPSSLSYRIIKYRGNSLLLTPFRAKRWRKYADTQLAVVDCAGFHLSNDVTATTL